MVMVRVRDQPPRLINFLGVPRRGDRVLVDGWPYVVRMVTWGGSEIWLDVSKAAPNE